MMGRVLEHRSHCGNAHSQMNAGHPCPKSYFSQSPLRSVQVHGSYMDLQASHHLTDSFSLPSFFLSFPQTCLSHIHPLLEAVNHFHTIMQNKALSSLCSKIKVTGPPWLYPNPLRCLAKGLLTALVVTQKMSRVPEIIFNTIHPPPS